MSIKKKKIQKEKENFQEIIADNHFRSVKLNIKNFNLTDKQKSFAQIAFDKNTKIIFINGPAGSAKAQPLDADILTVSGWKKMGQLQIGDQVYSVDGNPTSVLGVFPQGKKEIYKVTFSDGTFTECCGEHLWLTQTNNERYGRKRIVGKRSENIRYKSPKQGKVRNTLEILNTLYTGNIKRPNHYIPLTEAVNFNETKLPLHPYLLGALLGDGDLTGSSIILTSADEEIINKIQSLLPSRVNINKIKSSQYGYSITDDESSWIKPNRVKVYLKELDLMHKNSQQKFIPDCYKFNSIENRLELLRGLMDTDGTTSGYYTSFTTISDSLAKDVIFIVQSLGGTASFSKKSSSYIKNGTKIQCCDAYKINIKLPNKYNPFYLSRKANKIKISEKYFPRRSICNIEKIGEKECQCIYVEDDSHTYLTNDFIVTHNTFLAVYCALHILNMNPRSELKYIRTIAESGERALGSLPGTVDEKFNPFMMPLYDKLDELITVPQSKYLETNGFIEALPINFLRGATWNEKIIIADESQNYSTKELVTLLTRIGEGTKMFICGDAMQSDIGNKSGFMRIYDLFNNKESEERGIYCFQFDEEDIMRSEILKYIVATFKKLDKTNIH